MKNLKLKSIANSITLICLSLLITGITAVAQAQEENQPVQKQETQAIKLKHRKCYLSIGGHPFFIGDTPMGGGNLAFGFMPTPKNLMTFEVGGGGGDNKKLGSYSYSLYNKNTGQVIETKHDGKIKYGYSFVEVMLAYNRMVNLSEKWKFRIGPTLGLLVITGSDSYSPTSYKGVDIEGIPDTQSESQSAFMAGAIAGFQWNFARRWFIDLNYRVSYQTNIEFKEKTIRALGDTYNIESKEFGNLGNRINLAIGFRF